MASITIDNLTKRYGETLAVDDVSLDIQSGELFFLLGPSGCGKTTLLRMLAGLVEPTVGRILFDSKDVTATPTGQRGTALVFQSYALWPHMTVRENVAFGLDVRKMPADKKSKRVAWALDIVHMNEYADRKPAQLSGGQQQRVAVARALAVQPDVLLLDEPLSNLDAKLRLEMRDEIRLISRETGITMVYVTHDQDEALSMADRLAVMHEGQILQVGTPQELYRSPTTRFVAGFLGHANFLDGRVTECRQGRCVIQTQAGPVVADCDKGDLAENAEVTCVVRPEAIRLVTNGDRTDNTMQGTLAHTSFSGAMAQHTVQVADGPTVRISEIKPQREVTIGAGVTLGFNASDVVLLAR